MFLKRSIKPSRVLQFQRRYLDTDFVDDHIACLTLHPVTWPNHGAKIELSLASEALGLVRSLDWDIVKGPTKVIKVEG
jgi:hypothetical protein